MTLDALHAHQKEHHKIASGILRYIARHADLSYPDVREDFITGGPEITSLFWDMLHDLHPGRFVGVSWCHSCRKFNLEEVTH